MTVPIIIGALPTPQKSSTRVIIQEINRHTKSGSCMLRAGNRKLCQLPALLLISEVFFHNLIIYFLLGTSRLRFWLKCLGFIDADKIKFECSCITYSPKIVSIFLFNSRMETSYRDALIEESPYQNKKIINIGSAVICKM